MACVFCRRYWVSKDGRTAKMFESLFQPTHLLLIVIVALPVFGPKNLSSIGKGLGEAIRGFKKALNEEEPSSPTSHQVGKEEERRKKTTAK
jgi:sec-independent protein translocase protein TatA